MLRITTLGALRLTGVGDGETPHLRRKPLALLCYIARRAPTPVSRTELATNFWGERGEERARQSLRQALVELKHALGDRIDVDVDTVRLAPNAIELDVTEFERDVAAGRAADGVARWTGEFFDGGEDIGGEGFRRWIDGERESLHQLLSMAMDTLIGDAVREGDWSRAAALGERWTDALPLDERAHLRLIEVMRMAGRNGDALRVHAAFVARVKTVLDLEPSPEFMRMAGGLAETARSDMARQGQGSAAMRTPSLIGRAAVMRELKDAWSAATAGPGVVVSVRGDAGSGLTRICDAMEECARAASADCLVFRTRGCGPEPAFGTASALFDGLRSAGGSAGAAPEALAEVARLVPELHSQFRHLPDARGDDDTLRESLLHVIAAVVEEQPLLMIVDDLQLADIPSRRLMSSIAIRLPRGAMFLVAKADGPAAFPGAPDDMLAARTMMRLHLGALTPGEVDALLASMLTMAPDERRALSERLHDEVGGLPHPIVYTVAALVDEQLLRVNADGTWQASPALAGRPLPIPPVMRERTRARLDRLGTTTRSVAEALAVLGESADSSLLAAVVEGSRDDVEEALGELATLRLLRESGDAPGRYAYATTLLARTTVSLIPHARREALHARIVAVLEARDAGGTAEHTLLSYHLSRAPTPERPSRVVRSKVPWYRGRGAFAIALVGVASMAGAALKLGRARSQTDESAPVIALGHIADYRPVRDTELARPLSDMLATNLGRVSRLRVVSSARMYELVNQAGADTSSSSLVAAARRAGATELVDGALYAKDDGGFRLDLRRVELAGGSIRQTYSIVGRSLFELADSGTARLASDFGSALPTGSIADVTTRSLVAYRLYEQGLRLYFANDYAAAEPLFSAALKEDSTFAMAAYYSALTASASDAMTARFALAARLAQHASDRERLIVQAHFDFLATDPKLLAVAETLVVKYPDEVEGYYFTGLGRMMDGRFLAALAPLSRAVSMDSLALAGDRARCVACASLHQIVSVYQLSDSLSAAEREARRWLRLQPRSPVPWNHLADVLTQQGKADEAVKALDQAAALEVGKREGLRLLILANHRMYAGDFAQADRLYSGEIESGSPARALAGYWFRGTSYRNQGRLEEALADARRERALALPRYSAEEMKRSRSLPQELYLEGQVLHEMGRYAAAAEVFDSVGRWNFGPTQISQSAHQRAWSMTHATSARLAGGDTTNIQQRIDSVETIGAVSGLKRDHLLHHHLRGLLLALRGDDAGAVAEFRKAIFSMNFGYTRTNVAMARSLLRLGRPADAVAVLQPALRGDLEASNFYVTRTDLHELLALAWDAVPGAAARDSARAHMAYVSRAWSRADSSFATRLARMRAGPSRVVADR